MNADLKELKNTVIDGGYCVGCGACSIASNFNVAIKLDQYGMLTANTTDAIVDTVNYQSVCPFSNAAPNESVIGQKWYGNEATPHEKIGYYLDTYAGYVEEGDFRAKGSSGGMGSWIGHTLMKLGLVDGVIHVASKEYTVEDPRLFSYSISTTLEEVEANSKSRYYPIELSEVLHKVKEMPGRYVLVGIPCFIKAVRLLQLQDPILKEKIAYCIGLICGHLKSKRFAEMFGWQCEIEPANLRSIDFRNKIEGYGANQYGVKVTGLVNGELVEKTSPPVNQMYGTNWGFGYFKYKSCDYCDDVLAETADITIGDAWLPQYVKDSKGTNVIVVRNKVLAEIVKAAKEEGRLMLDEITPEQVVQSQKSGFEHRREGLAFRLGEQDKKGNWRPEKRVKAIADSKNEVLIKKQVSRTELAELSHVAFNNAILKNEFNVFVKEMNEPLQRYRKLYQLPLSRRIFKKVESIFASLLKKIS